MSSLYVLTSEYNMLAARLADADFDAQTIADTIEGSGLTDELAVKAQNIEHIARAALSHHDAIDAEIFRLKALKEKRDLIAEGLRDYLKENMERAGIEKIECPLFSISIRKNPPSVEITNTDDLPFSFWRTPEQKPPAPAPDKDAIKLALKRGEDVPGARLNQTTRLDIK